MKNILSTEKVPYLLTILFAVLGWTITHTVDRLTSSPIIEYNKSVQKLGSEYLNRIIVSNITLSNTFRNISFSIQSIKSKDIVENAELNPVEPLLVHEKPHCDKESCEFSIDELHPGMQFYISVKTRSNTGVRLNYSCSTNSIKLMPTSIQTYIVRHEISLLSLLTVIWIVVIVGYAALSGDKTNV